MGFFRSAPINLEDIGTSYFRLRVSDSRPDVFLMRADVKLGGSTIFVVISQASEGWPFIIENESDHDFAFYQTVSALHRFLCVSSITHIY